MTLLDLKKMLNSFKEFYNNPSQLNIEITKTYKRISENISNDLDKLIFIVFDGYVKNLKVNISLLNREARRLKNNKVKGRSVFDRIERNRKKLIKNLTQIFKKKNIEEKAKTKVANNRVRMEFNSLKKIVKNSAHRIKEKTKDFFFKKANKIVELKKLWICTFNNSRDAHKDMHKQEADEDGYFTAPSGQKTQYPSGFGVPELDINCNCYIRIVKVKK